MGRPIVPDNDKAHPNDKICCDVCSNEYTRSNKSKHDNSKWHKMAANMIRNNETVFIGGTSKNITDDDKKFIDTIRGGGNNNKGRRDISSRCKKYEDIHDSSSDSSESEQKYIPFDNRLNKHFISGYNKGRRDFGEQLKSAFDLIYENYDTEDIPLYIIYKLIDPELNDQDRINIISNI